MSGYATMEKYKHKKEKRETLNYNVSQGIYFIFQGPLIKSKFSATRNISNA